MNDGLLSQDEINALLNGAVAETPQADEDISESDKDLLGEIGNISMGSASTALSTIISKMVNITTPRVSVTTLEEMKKHFEIPMIALEVEFTEGLSGVNLLLIKITDAAVIADLMMGGSGEGKADAMTLSEIEISAVSEAMNQMIGSAATSLSTMLNIPVNISPPIAKVWNDVSSELSERIVSDDKIVRISFKLTIEPLVDSEIMLLFTMQATNTIIGKMTGDMQTSGTEEPSGFEEASDFNFGDDAFFESEPVQQQAAQAPARVEAPQQQPQRSEPVNVKKAQFAPLSPVSSKDTQNIDLILDVPLEISVVLGRTKKTIKEILALGTGSLIELEKLTEEPVEVLVNGKKVALAEVVVIDENFGVRITSIISNTERVKSLQG